MYILCRTFDGNFICIKPQNQVLTPVLVTDSGKRAITKDSCIVNDNVWNKTYILITCKTSTAINYLKFEQEAHE